MRLAKKLFPGTCCPVIFLLVFSVPQVKTEEQIAAEQAWYGSEKVWLVHKDGFSLGEIKLLLYTQCIDSLLNTSVVSDFVLSSWQTGTE